MQVLSVIRIDWTKINTIIPLFYIAINYLSSITSSQAICHAYFRMLSAVYHLKFDILTPRTIKRCHLTLSHIFFFQNTSVIHAFLCYLFYLVASYFVRNNLEKVESFPLQNFRKFSSINLDIS